MSLHTTEVVALVELWSGIKTYVPVKDQRSAAEHFITSIDEAGLVDLSVAGPELYGVCDTFDKALRTYVQENMIEDQDHEDWDE